MTDDDDRFHEAFRKACGRVPRDVALDSYGKLRPRELRKIENLDDEFFEKLDRAVEEYKETPRR